ncbi:Ig-like domain-containing protein, partial [Ruegeria hyattellae]|uniref:Ig-like domain-containing protein n=1 Tax=Ruegeria hyattellae TaxID=3233337 RepID=UPI00355AE95C
VRFTTVGDDTLLEINPDGASGFVPVALLTGVKNLAGTEAAMEANGRLITMDPPPVANDDYVSVESSGSWTIDVLSNDVDPDADYLTTLEVSGIAAQPGNGSVAIVNGEVVYTPTAGYVGSDSFDYTISDGKSSDSATVFLSVGQRDFTGESRALTVDLSQSSYAFAATVMAFGDSLTQGYKFGNPDVEGGFRDDLFDTLSANNIWIDYVGRFNDGPDGMIDRDHNATPGHTLAEALTDDPSAPMNFSLTVDEINPDVTWFMMGTNDLNGPTKVDQVLGGIQALIDQFYALEGAQDRHLVISLVPVKPAFADIVAATNEGYSMVNGEMVAGDAGNGTFVPGIRQIVSSEAATHPTLHLFEPPITENELLPDQVHFTDAGDALYAQAMADLLEEEIGFSAGTIEGSGISLDAVNVIGGEAGDLLIGDAQANLLDGGNGNDVIRGSAGDDSLLGGAGTDRLDGGAGADTLTGGEGDDSFIFGADFALNAASADAILDFGDQGSDRLVFEQSLGAATVADQLDGTGVVITINGSDIDVDGASAGLLKGASLGGGSYEITSDTSLVLFVQDPDILLA